MASAWKDHLGTVLSNVLQTLLTFAASTVTGGGRLMNVQVTTDGATARTLEVYLIPSGQTAAAQYLIYKGLTIPNDTFALPGGPWIASASAFVQAKVNAGTDVTVRCSALEETS